MTERDESLLAKIVEAIIPCAFIAIILVEIWRHLS